MEVKKVVELTNSEAAIIDEIYNYCLSVKEAIDHQRVMNNIRHDTTSDDRVCSYPYEQFRALMEDLSCIRGLLSDLSPSVKQQFGKNARF